MKKALFKDKVFVIGALTNLLPFVCMFICFSAAVSASITTITDEPNDVMNELSDIVTDDNIANNIDIVKIEFFQKDNSITLTLKVNGILENKGSLDDIKNMYGNMDDIADIIGKEFAFYTLDLNTEKTTYSVVYINKQCMVNNNTISCTSEDDYFTVSFPIAEDDVCISLSAISSYFNLVSLQNLRLYIDETSGALEDNNIIPDEQGIDNESNNIQSPQNENEQQSNQNFFIFIIVIGTFIIGGIGTVIYVIRRR